MIVFLQIQQYTRRYPTWEADDAEGRAEEEDRVADVVEVEVLDAGHGRAVGTGFGELVQQLT